MTQMRAVSGRLHLLEGTIGERLMDEVAHRARGDEIVRALENEGRHFQACEVGAIVGEKSRFSESSSNHRIGGAETLSELRGQLGPIGILHHDRAQEIGPPDVVLLHRLEQAIDVGALEPADVGWIVDVARRRADKNEPLDRKSTRLNSSHVEISYAVFCLKKKKKRNGKVFDFR